MEGKDGAGGPNSSGILKKGQHTPLENKTDQTINTQILDREAARLGWGPRRGASTPR
jgi:hypothetical protein